MCVYLIFLISITAASCQRNRTNIPLTSLLKWFVIKSYTFPKRNITENYRRWHHCVFWLPAIFWLFLRQHYSVNCFVVLQCRFAVIAVSYFCTSPIAFDWFYICIISWLLDLEDGFYPAFTMAFLHRSSVMPFIESHERTSSLQVTLGCKF